MTFVIKQAGVTLTQSGLKKLNADAMMAPGVLSLIDFTNPACNDGLSIGAAKPFHNLITGAPDATASAALGQWPGTGLPAGTPAGIYFKNTQNFISMGPSGKFAATDTSVLVIVWIRWNTISNSLENCYVGCGDTTTGSETCQFILGKTPQNNLQASAQAQVTTAGNGLPSNGLYQVAVEWTAGGFSRAWFNQSIRGTAAAVSAGSTLTVPSSNPRIGQLSGFNNNTCDFVVYRVMFESLTQSGRTAPAVMAADYAANFARISALG